MGKDLKGKELGRGLSQRPDGRYMGRAQVEGKPIVLYGWKVKELKKELVRAVDDLKRSNLLPEEDGTGITPVSYTHLICFRIKFFHQFLFFPL